jgi:hypothetical protein
MPALDRQAELDAADAEIEANLGGNPETKRKHQKWLELWEIAMAELGVQPDLWYILDVPIFRAFSKWALASLEARDLNVFTAMLNSEHRHRFNDGMAPWNKHADILEIKKAYEVAVSKRREHKRAILQAAGLATQTKKKRITFPDSYLGRVIEQGEWTIGSDAAVWCEMAGERDRRLLGLLAWLLLLVLFAVRASTLGAMKQGDVYVQDGKLCLMLRHIKWWIAGRQLSRNLPFPREGRYGIPFSADGSSYRDRAVRIIMCASVSGSLMFGTVKGPDGAARWFNDSLIEFGWLSETEVSKSTSHSGRKTCIAAGSALGVSNAVLKEWMLVLDEKTVETYSKGEANFLPGPITRDLIGFLLDLV